MEMFIRDSTFQFMQSNNILTNKQFDFIKGSSTTVQSLTAMDEWTEILQKGKMVDFIYFDFQKAFETVPNRQLIVVMKYYQIDDPVALWVSGFFTGPNQQVLIDVIKSIIFDVALAVPEG